MKNKGVIIQGSARSFGNTNKVVKHLAEQTEFEIIDLNTKTIGQFDYEFKNIGDDFMPLIKEIISNYETIVFATPVYWYSMSGIMKAFFDRVTDLLKIEKDFGRKLRGKNMAMLSCSEDPNLPEGYTVPFSESADYLGMNYLGDIHAWIKSGEIPNDVFVEMDIFAKKLVR